MMTTAVVTGASRGIGKAIAENLADKYNIALISRHIGDVESVARELGKEHEGIYLPFECDVCDKRRVSETFEEIFNRFGSVDVLVNNAGINSRRKLNPGSSEDWFRNFDDNLLGWEEEIRTNLTGAYMCSCAALGYMLRQRRGSIINISSIKGKEPSSSPGYGVSKAGLIYLTKDLAKELAPYGIRVNCVAPGFIDTGMTAELPEEKKKFYMAMIPLKRFGSAGDVAQAVRFLVSDDSAYMIGATLDVNGGYLM